MNRHIGRRTVLSSAAAVVVVASRPVRAQQSPPAWQARLMRIAAGRTIERTRVRIRVPEIAENGSTVPVTVSVDGPMTAENYVKTLHVISDGNPNPEVLTAHFTPASGKAEVSVRIRLARTSNLIVFAETSDGSLLAAQAEAMVTIGGCG